MYKSLINLWAFCHEIGELGNLGMFSAEVRSRSSYGGYPGVVDLQGMLKGIEHCHVEWKGDFELDRQGSRSHQR